MADFKWDDYPVEGSEPAAAKTPAFNWDDHPLETPESTGDMLSRFGSALLSGKSEDLPELKGIQQTADDTGRGVLQGLTFGHSDELGGAYDAPLGAAKEIANKFGAGYDDEDVKAYKNSRDQSRMMDAKAHESSPYAYTAGEIGGSLPTMLLPGINAGAGAGLAEVAARAAAQGALTGVGSDSGGSIGDLANSAAHGAGVGAVSGGVGYGLGQGISKGIEGAGKLFGKAGDALTDSAEKLAVKATGATGRESQKFADNAGRELLDQGLVKFGDTPADVATRVGSASKQAGDEISSSLKSLDAQGARSSAGNVIAGLNEEIQKLSKNPSQAGTARKLKGIVDDILNTGESSTSLSQGEEIKRGFRKAAGNWMDPEAGAASKKAYLSYMDEVERAANELDPSLADKFIKDKETYGLLAPIKEASERRAAQLNQSPFGGFGDIAAIGAGATAGAVAGGLPGAAIGALAPIARRVISPRLASMGAVTTDGISKILQAAPQALGKFAPVFQNAAQRGSQAIAATHFILEQSNPEYREMIRHMQDMDNNK